MLHPCILWLLTGKDGDMRHGLVSRKGKALVCWHYTEASKNGKTFSICERA